jgi:hypothetical protein
VSKESWAVVPALLYRLREGHAGPCGMTNEEGKGKGNGNGNSNSNCNCNGNSKSKSDRQRLFI